MSSLWNDLLVGRLAQLFKSFEETDIDKAVNRAKNQLAGAKDQLAGAKDQLAEEIEKVKHEDLEKLFDSQIQTLKDRGCPSEIVKILKYQRSLVLQKANEMSFAGGNIPFIPVIPRAYRSPYDLMAMVRIEGRQGYSYLNPIVITDEFDTPEDPYYIYDVEDGRACLGKSPDEAINIFKKQARSALTAAEVMALTINTDVLSKHYVNASGSSYDANAIVVPSVSVYSGLWPELRWVYFGRSDRCWGSASCGSR